MGHVGELRRDPRHECVLLVGQPQGHRLAVLGDGEFLALGYPLQVLGKVRFGLERSDGFHAASK